MTAARCLRHRRPAHPLGLPQAAQAAPPAPCPALSLWAGCSRWFRPCAKWCCCRCYTRASSSGWASLECRCRGTVRPCPACPAGGVCTLRIRGSAVLASRPSVKLTAPRATCAQADQRHAACCHFATSRGHACTDSLAKPPRRQRKPCCVPTYLMLAGGAAGASCSTGCRAPARRLRCGRWWVSASACRRRRWHYLRARARTAWASTMETPSAHSGSCLRR